MNTEPVKATRRAHGNLKRLMYFGMGTRPNREGVLVTVENMGRSGYNLITADGSPVEGKFWTFAPATKFWGTPV